LCGTLDIDPPDSVQNGKVVKKGKVVAKGKVVEKGKDPVVAKGKKADTSRRHRSMRPLSTWRTFRNHGIFQLCMASLI
jgi:hypothetical protein